MGQQFFYCQTCGTRVTGDDLQSGGAQRTSTRISCVECVRKKTRRKQLEPLRTEPAEPAP